MPTLLYAEQFVAEIVAYCRPRSRPAGATASGYPPKLTVKADLRTGNLGPRTRCGLAQYAVHLVSPSLRLRCRHRPPSCPSRSLSLRFSTLYSQKAVAWLGVVRARAVSDTLVRAAQALQVDSLAPDFPESASVQPVPTKISYRWHCGQPRQAGGIHRRVAGILLSCPTPRKASASIHPNGLIFGSSNLPDHYVPPLRCYCLLAARFFGRGSANVYSNLGSVST
jgi:hypothetical protein